MSYLIKRGMHDPYIARKKKLSNQSCMVWAKNYIAHCACMSDPSLLMTPTCGANNSHAHASNAGLRNTHIYTRT